jgi:outer membrane lipoprotein-sorting protein
MNHFQVLACALAASLCASSAAYALDADQLIAKNIAARGGMEALNGIKNIKAQGKVNWGGGDFSLELASVQYVARPANMRMEATFQGLTMVQAYDGKEGWMISPFQGRKDPQRSSPDESKGNKLSADLEGVLVNAKAKGYEVEYLGLEDVDGTMAHKLRVKLNASDTRTVFLDPDHFLEIRYEDRLTVRGAESVMKTDVGDYEKVNGWYMPFYFEMGGQKVTFDRIDANVELDAAMFSFPASAAAK